MTEPNVLNYFLIILGGFGVVWSYRYFSKHQDRRIGEFEYAAFSALWGIPLFLFFVELIKSKPEMLNSIFVMPMIATPTLFLMGLFFGYVGSELMSMLRDAKQYLSDRSIQIKRNGE